MYELYELNKSQLIEYKSTKFEYKIIEVSKLKSEIWGKGIKQFFVRVMWNLITFGRVKAYVIRDVDGKIIHYSCVIPKCFKFPFLNYGDIEIGPCATEKEYRGQGIYPYVLSHIVFNELGENNIAYMIIKDANTASINGVKKVGFTVTARMKKNRWGSHVIDKRYS